MLDIRTLLLRTAEDRYEASAALRTAEAAVWPLLRARGRVTWTASAALETRQLGIPA
ncbi:MAG TPA: hypothetical protein VH879_13265 [Gemmatimonadales bacterium]|jgi:hypothetical protein